MDGFGLPAQARQAVRRIEGILAEAEPLLAASGDADAAFALRETASRYLPDTLAAYLAIPPSVRDETAATMLVAQLDVLERATRERLGRLAESSERALASNGAFLRERFAGLAPADPAPADSALAAEPLAASLPADPGEAAATGTPALLLRRFFDEIESAGTLDERALLGAVAARFTAVFPQLTSVRRGLLRSDVAAVAIDVPTASRDVMRFGLDRERTGLAASVTRVVRGIALRKEPCEPGEWAELLLAELVGYTERNRAAGSALTRLFAR